MHKEIVHFAWQITKENKKELFVYGFIPSFFTVLLWFIYISYQLQAFKHSEYFGWEELDYLGVAQSVWAWIVLHPWISTFIIVLAFFSFLMYLFSPVICESALIHGVLQARLGKPISWWLNIAFSKFFPLFEMATLLSPLHFVTFMTEWSFVIRNFWISTWLMVLPILMLVLFAGLLLNFLFAFAQQYIVLENKDMMAWMKLSTKLVLWNIRESFFLWWVMLVIIVRIFFNVLLILLIPLISMVVIQQFVKISIGWIGIWLSIVFVFWLIWMSAYLLAWISVFVSAVWTLAFLNLRKREIEATVNETHYKDIK